MNRTLRSCTLALLLAGPALAAEPAIAEGRLADGAVIAAHWAATPIGRLWADPSAAALRSLVQEADAKAGATCGAAPSAIVLAMRSTSLAVRKDGPSVAVRASSDVGPHAEAVMKTISGTPATVSGADQAVALPGKDAGLVARFATTVAFAWQGQPAVLTPGPLAAGDDASFTCDLQRLAAALPDSAAAEDPTGQATMRVRQALTSNPDAKAFTYRLAMTPAGVVERFTTDGEATEGCLPVDHALLKRLPANTLAVLSFGMNGAKQWQRKRVGLLNSWGPLLGCAPGTAADAIETALDKRLGEWGVSLSAKEVVGGLVGSGLIAVTNGAPFPGLCIVLPRTPTIDRLFGDVAKQFAFTLPAEGDAAMLPLKGVPVPLMLARDAGTWMLGSDAVVVDDWRAGTSGGWITTPAAVEALRHAGTDAWMIGACDTPALLRLFQSYAGFVTPKGPAANDDARAALLRSLPTMLGVLARNAATGYVVGRVTGPDQAEVEMRSLTGIAPLVVEGGILGATIMTSKPAQGRKPKAEAADGSTPSSATNSQLF